jgi:hypothetical protein
VPEHRLGQDERADEGEHRRRAEGRHRLVGRDDAEDDDRPDADEPTDRDRHRLGDPQDDDAEQHRGEQVLLTRQVQRQQRHDHGDRGCEEQADRPAPLLEPLLGRAEGLLPQAAIGRRADEGRVDVRPRRLLGTALGGGHRPSTGRT